MTKKLVWLMLGCLIVTALVLASCSSDTTTDTTTDTATTTDTTTDTPEATGEEPGPGMVVDSLGRLVEKPQYGGTIIFGAYGFEWEPQNQDASSASSIFERLTLPDWTRGPSGTGEFPMNSDYLPTEMWVGGLAESWEIIDLTTAIFHIRPGIMWQDSPLLNGRELVADDVLYSVDRIQDNPRSYGFYRSSGAPRITATAVDKYTVEIMLPEPDPMGWYRINSSMVIVPSEVEAAGSNWDDWRTSIETGTGPYILEDVVAASSITWRRNPNYWQYDVLHPENKLPYPDYVKGLTIDDESALVSALRTGKIDFLASPSQESQLDLMERNPELRYSELSSNTQNMVFRSDSEVLGDKRVRQALHMAVDNDAILRDLFAGKGTWRNFPYDPSLGPDIYTPLEELPPEIREIYTYNPEKARQLLAEAGYPDGFEFEVMTYAYGVVDMVTIYQHYFKDIGVDMTIDLVEYGGFWAKAADRAFEDAIASDWGYASTPYKVWGYLQDKNHLYNFTNFGDPYIAEQYAILGTLVDSDEINKILRELDMHLKEEAYFMTFPVPVEYVFWQPWIKGYNGEYYSWGARRLHAWVDQELKTEMGH